MSWYPLAAKSTGLLASLTIACSQSDGGDDTLGLDAAAAETGPGTDSGGAQDGTSGPAADEIAVQSPDGTITYHIDRTEVTRNAYAAWLATNPSAQGQPAPCASNADFTPTCEWPPNEKGLHPVVCVDWCDAVAYCKGVGKRLCGKIGGGEVDYFTPRSATVCQWYNACTSQGLNDYPYGPTYDEKACHTATNGPNTTSEVGAYPGCKTPSGIVDLSGNVWEWRDACNPENDYCRLGGGAFNAQNPDDFSCNSGGADNLRLGHWNSVGFRCCRD